MSFNFFWKLFNNTNKVHSINWLKERDEKLFYNEHILIIVIWHLIVMNHRYIEVKSVMATVDQKNGDHSL